MIESSKKLLPSAMLSLGVVVLPGAGCLSSAPAVPPTPEAPADMAQPPLDAPVNRSARAIFDQDVVPLLLPTCGVCHKTQGGVGPAFLASGSPTNYDPYLVTSGWPAFIPGSDNPALSALLTKGQHEGPALTLDQYAAVLNWVTQELEERAASTPQPFNPAIKPFIPTIGAVNTVQLGSISSQFAGAYISFNAILISPTMGLELTNLRFFNVKPGAVAGDQRAIHMQRPLFVMWQGTTAVPDPVDSFASTDLTFPLEIPPGATQPVGQLITPGILTLAGYRPGAALSLSFNLLQLVPPAAGSNPCKQTIGAGQTMSGIDTFYAQVQPYLAKAGSCTQSNACHTAQGKAGGINMAPLFQPVTDPTLIALCETLKFYNSVGTLANNTDPNGMYTHPFKWTSTAGGNCQLNGYPSTCFTDFSTALTSWKNAEK